jgi:3-hydroxyisobutyrate dehydrogenase-like beta-hydroxyacid dehydrogenase
MKRKAAFVGVDAIGRPMARNLVQKGFEVTVCDIDSARLKLPRMIGGDFRPGFAIDLAHKDLSIVLAMAGQLKTCLPLAATAREALGAARARGLGGLDTSATVLLYENPK